MKYIIICSILLIISLIMRFINQNAITGFGYKSKLSTKNIDTWNEGNRYCGSIIMIGSLICIILGLLLFFNKYDNMEIIFYINIAFMLLACIFTEIHLRKIFEKDGSKKQ